MVSQFAFYVGNLIGRDLISSLAGWHAVRYSFTVGEEESCFFFLTMKRKLFGLIKES
jgi:hypothetical protein